MTKRIGILQKISLVSAIVSFVLALASGVMLYFRLETHGSEDTVSASLMASVFFFVCVGVVLLIMGTANLPSFKFDKPDENGER